MNPPVIKFSHRYVKMPAGFENSCLTSIDVVNIEDLDADFIEADTAIVGGGHYELPKKGRFMVLHLETPGKESWQSVSWQTIRRWTERKANYYRKHIGEMVRCEIVEAA